MFKQFREFSGKHAWPISLLIVAGYFCILRCQQPSVQTHSDKGPG